MSFASQRSLSPLKGPSRLAMTQPANNSLPKIPLHDLGERSPVALVGLEQERTHAIIAAAEDFLPRAASAAVIALGDRLSRRWLAQADNPYRQEIAAVEAAIGRPGAAFLNLNYEWACSSGVSASPTGPEPRLVRVLDWRLPALGANLIAVKRRTTAGVWTELTWPGFTGVLQASAPGRFAAAINQAPLAKRTGGRSLDWAAGRLRFLKQRALPPAHLLRQVFESAQDYQEAKRRLAETPIALPAIFTLAGCKAGEGCVIERRETAAAVREMPTTAANHWQGFDQAAWPRGRESTVRARNLAPALGAAWGDLAWLQPPILNPMTRLVMQAVPAGGRFWGQGFEPQESPGQGAAGYDGPPAAAATQPLDLDQTPDPALEGGGKAAE